DKVGTDEDVARQAQEFIKKQSGSLHGIVNNGITLNSNNVWIQNVMQGYQLRHTASLAQNYETNQMITSANVSYTRVENTFYSAMFVVNAKATVDHSYFTNTGSAIFCMADDYQYGSDTENETSYATFDATKSGVPYDPELIADSSNVYDSWAVGNEAYYSTEEGMGALALNLKQTVNEALTKFGTNHTITDGEKFNFILQFISEVKYKKMKVTFVDGENQTVLDRGALYATTQTANDARLGVMGGNFLYPIGKYSDFENYVSMAMTMPGVSSPADLMNPQYIAMAVGYSFNNDLATFGANNDRKMLEVIAPDGMGKEITAIVEVMPVAQ
ncbi:MAG: hypothetical protein IKA90_05675, partial [Clostridia bacterium]|nr:hypothetical protein [Clostridia bacterium]